MKETGLPHTDIAFTEIAYIAGIIDGEGCIMVKKTKAYLCQDRQTPGYIVAIQIKMVDEAAIAFIAETLGGWYYRQKPSAAKGRPLYCWQVSHKHAEKVLRRVLPYLRVKREPALAALALRELQATSVQHRTKVVGSRNFPNRHGTVRMVDIKILSDEYVAQCEALYQRCKECNRVGVF